jgi:hypothetical protein
VKLMPANNNDTVSCTTSSASKSTQSNIMHYNTHQNLERFAVLSFKLLKKIFYYIYCDHYFIGKVILHRFRNLNVNPTCEKIKLNLR